MLCDDIFKLFRLLGRFFGTLCAKINGHDEPDPVFEPVFGQKSAYVINESAHGLQRYNFAGYLLFLPLFNERMYVGK